MIIPEDMLKTLLCVQCKLYLSVPPIKVYPNRHVKCGRCVRDDDNGVVSPHYETVIRNFEFPCIHRYSGCSRILKYNEVKMHEQQCFVGPHNNCPFCDRFRGDSYYLHLHLQNHHMSNSLHNSEVFIELDKGNVQNTVWFVSPECRLLMIFLNYDSLENRIRLDVSIVGGESNNKHLSQVITLYTYDRKTKVKSKSIPTVSIWNSESADTECAEFQINPGDFPRNVALCEFVLHEFLSLIEPNCPTKISPDLSDFIFDCNFKEMSKMIENKKYFFDFEFYVNKLKVKMFIKKATQKRTTSLIMAFCREDEKTKPTSDFAVDVTLISKDPCKNLIKSFKVESRHWKNKKAGESSIMDWKSFLEESLIISRTSKLFITDWNSLFQPSNGYLNNDSIKMKIRIQVKNSVTHKRAASCSDCTMCASCVKKCDQFYSYNSGKRTKRYE